MSEDRPNAHPTGIVGGGLAGLVLARMLVRGGLPVTVLERDASAHDRPQGGSLDLHPESGQRALSASGLIEQFRRHARPQGEEIRILGPDAQEHVRHRGAATPDALIPDADGILPGRPEIDRTLLRSLLLASLPDGTVRWGQHVVDIEAIDGGGYRVSSADGSVSDFGLLVGADGARSRVRPLLTTAEPEPLGVSNAMMSLDLDRRPDLADLIGDGSLWCLGSNVNVGAQRSGTHDVRVSVMLRENASGPHLRPGVTKRDLLELLADWSPVITDLVASANDDIVVYEIATLPTTLTWPSRPDLTLIGDAAHLMPPVGEGANQAMLDAAELGRALVAAPHDRAAAISSAEAAMFARVQPVAEESARIQAAIVAPDALATMTRMFGG